MLDKNSIANIKVKQNELKITGDKLKEHFVGLDPIIDKIIKNIEIWYVMPELITRPVIINLWGMTGVGKTDLVRRLVDILKYNDRFCEIELSNNGSSTYPYYSRISGILSDNPNIVPGKPAILLLDEIQRFRMVDRNGDEIENYKFSDIWTLLSDGKLPCQPDINYLLQYLYETPTTEDNKSDVSFFSRKNDKSDEDEDYTYYQIRDFKNALRLDESIEEISKWDKNRKRSMVISKLKSDHIYKHEDYSKILIFISGNIDEAFKFASMTSETDLDADILHEQSLRINLLDIKEALRSRFRPEQISRLGNTHIIYPSLSKDNYLKIINHRLAELKNGIENTYNISIDFDKSIRELIYNNGVYPTQGVRPVLSTISEIVENNIPFFLLHSLMNDINSFKISYSNNTIQSKINGSIQKIHYIGELDYLKLQKRSNVDMKALHAVHEAGHAVVYAFLFNTAPKQIMINTASDDTGGFISMHQNCRSKNFILKEIAAIMAGREAERITFGENHMTMGCQNDVAKATELAAYMVREWGMHDYLATYAFDPNTLRNGNNGLHLSNSLIEEIMRESCEEANMLLCENEIFFKEIVRALIENDSINPEEFKLLCEKHNVHVKIHDPKSEICEQYSSFIS